MSDITKIIIQYLRPKLFKFLRILRIQILSNYLDNLEWNNFYTNNPTLKEYLKSYKTPSELVNKLINQGLIISHSSNAEKIIYNNNYYRFKAYFIPFLDANKRFTSGTFFSEVYALYLVDQKIRDFIFPILAKLEVAIRANLDNLITCHTNDPFWHLNQNYFENYDPIKEALRKAGGRFETGKQEFVLHYKNNYYTKKSFEYKKIPPFWIISEIFTIEQLLTISRNIKKSAFAITPRINKLNECAVNFGFDSYDTLVTNLTCILEVRNICAHHSRLWNRNLRDPSALKKKINIPIKTKNRLYSHLVMLRIMCKSQNIDDGIKDFFIAEINAHSILQRHKNSMGFPDNWETDKVWN